jgi:RsiW-degrading membrane proteinase PrsW (M82 family)
LTQRLRILTLLILPGGALLLATGAGCATLYVLLPFFYQGPDLLSTSLTVASVAAIGLTLGFGLTYQVRSFLRGRASATFHPPSPRRWVSLFLVCLIVGQLMITLLPHTRITALVFPPIHVLAAASPALAVLAFVGLRTRAASWRTVVMELSHGAVLAPAAALVAELVVVLGVVIVISVIVALTPGGLESLVDLAASLQDPAWLENPDNLAQLVLSPAALTGIVIVFVIMAPLIEEFFKGLGVLLLGFRLRGRAQALLWGVACGAGFAVGESLFNGSIAIDGWGAVLLMRAGASLMHCVASGFMGLGWHQALVDRRPWRLLAAYGASTLLHALWNAAAVSVAVLSLLVMSRPGDTGTQGFAAFAILGAMAFLLGLTVSMGIALILLTRRTVVASNVEQTSDQEASLSNSVL